MATNGHDYQVGYKKPPMHTRFKKGTSGNPKGRPQGSKNPGTLLQRALEELVIITEQGQRKRITKLEAMFKQLANKAASGDHRSMQLLLASLHLLEEHSGATPSDGQSLDDADRQVMQQLYERVRRWSQEENDEESQSN
jgi:hypothetical protein